MHGIMCIEPVVTLLYFPHEQMKQFKKDAFLMFEMWVQIVVEGGWGGGEWEGKSFTEEMEKNLLVIYNLKVNF